jgi:hypothetical protein
MKTESHIHAKITVEFDGDYPKQNIIDHINSHLNKTDYIGRVKVLSGEATHVINEGEIYNTEFEHKFVNLTLREGEREFDLRMSIQVETGLSDDEVFDKSIKGWFGEPIDITGKGEYEPMTKFEFDIVSKFT